MNNIFFSIDDARIAARHRLPKIIFDLIDGAAGDEYASAENITQLDQIRLQPRVLVNTENRNLKKSLFGKEWSLPFGIAPMGMCDLSWPGADKILAAVAVKYNMPLGLSTMASSNIEDTFERAGTNAWFQLYVGQSEDDAFDLVKRAQTAGYDTLILTADVPIVAPRPREQRHGLQVPLKIGPSQLIDFALHPQWSLATLLAGVPEMANQAGQSKISRNQARGRVDWAFLDRLRQRWPGKLIVKGVLSAEDAMKIRDAGADAVYVSNHGGRQLDSAPAAIQMLPKIRSSVGENYPILFDSGVRNGEAVIKALALGADFVLMGRPFLYALGGGGEAGLRCVIDLLSQQIEGTLAQLGIPDINDIDNKVIL